MGTKVSGGDGTDLRLGLAGGEGIQGCGALAGTGDDEKQGCSSVAKVSLVEFAPGKLL